MLVSTFFLLFPVDKLALTCAIQIALAEVHKAAPEVLRHFDMHMAHDRPWKTKNAGFNKQSDVIVKLTART